MNNLEEQNAIFILPKSEEGLQSSACSAVIFGIWHRFRGTGGGEDKHRLKTLWGKPLNGSQEEWVARWGDVGPGLGLFIFLCWFPRKTGLLIASDASFSDLDQISWWWVRLGVRTGAARWQFRPKFCTGSRIHLNIWISHAPALICVCVVIQIYETNKHRTKLVPMRINLWEFWYPTLI